MNLFQFMSESPWLTFFLACILANLLFRSWNRVWRAVNIWKNGWPPVHCDADGDLKEIEKDSDEN